MIYQDFESFITAKITQKDQIQWNVINIYHVNFFFFFFFKFAHDKSQKSTCLHKFCDNLKNQVQIIITFQHKKMYL